MGKEKTRKKAVPESASVRSIPIIPPAAPRIEFKTVSSEEIIGELKATGRGWSEEMRAVLALPPRLFERKSDNGSFYSRDLRFGIAEILSRIDSDSIGAREGDYGIALYSTGGGVYFVFADMGRRIVVRERIFSIHDKPPERDWKEVMEKITEALSAAAGERERAVVSDGIIRKARL